MHRIRYTCAVALVIAKVAGLTAFQTQIDGEEAENGTLLSNSRANSSTTTSALSPSDTVMGAMTTTFETPLTLPNIDWYPSHPSSTQNVQYWTDLSGNIQTSGGPVYVLRAPVVDVTVNGTIVPTISIYGPFAEDATSTQTAPFW
jgi:hypothetical protein